MVAQTLMRVARLGEHRRMPLEQRTLAALLMSLGRRIQAEHLARRAQPQLGVRQRREEWQLPRDRSDSGGFSNGWSWGNSWSLGNGRPNECRRINGDRGHGNDGRSGDYRRDRSDGGGFSNGWSLGNRSCSSDRWCCNRWPYKFGNRHGWRSNRWRSNRWRHGDRRSSSNRWSLEHRRLEFSDCKIDHCRQRSHLRDVQ